MPVRVLIHSSFVSTSALSSSFSTSNAGRHFPHPMIVLPMSLPAMATIGLFYAVGYWNNYYHAMLFITRPEVKPMQLYLYELISTATRVSELDPEMAMSVSSAGVQAGSILVGTLPILLLYPFAQKYFISGLTIGSVKG